jgi:antitoxin (DNA-binding transcriptional repressor) of toxin-antitoxin stability system
MTSKISFKEQIVPFKEFRTNAAKYIAAMEKGASFLVVKRSRPVFRLEPIDEVWETIGDFSELKKGGISAKELALLLA